MLNRPAAIDKTSFENNGGTPFSHQRLNELTRMAVGIYFCKKLMPTG